MGDPRRASLAEEIQNEETNLKQCMEKLKLVESNRGALVSQLKDALKEQVLCFSVYCWCYRCMFQYFFLFFIAQS